MIKNEGIEGIVGIKGIIGIIGSTGRYPVSIIHRIKNKNETETDTESEHVRTVEWQLGVRG